MVSNNLKNSHYRPQYQSQGHRQAYHFLYHHLHLNGKQISPGQLTKWGGFVSMTKSAVRILNWAMLASRSRVRIAYHGRNTTRTVVVLRDDWVSFPISSRVTILYTVSAPRVTIHWNCPPKKRNRKMLYDHCSLLPILCVAKDTRTSKETTEHAFQRVGSGHRRYLGITKHRLA